MAELMKYLLSFTYGFYCSSLYAYERLHYFIFFLCSPLSDFPNDKICYTFQNPFFFQTTESEFRLSVFFLVIHVVLSPAKSNLFPQLLPTFHYYLFTYLFLTFVKQEENVKTIEWNLVIKRRDKQKLRSNQNKLI